MGDSLFSTVEFLAAFGYDSFYVAPHGFLPISSCLRSQRAYLSYALVKIIHDTCAIPVSEKTGAVSKITCFLACLQTRCSNNDEHGHTETWLLACKKHVENISTDITSHHIAPLSSDAVFADKQTGNILALPRGSILHRMIS